MGYGYTPFNSNASTANVRSIDYFNNRVLDLTFQDLPHYLNTMKGMNSYSFDFSDYFLAVRNTSGLTYNDSLVAYEEAYQFIGNQIVFFRARVLNTDK